MPNILKFLLPNETKFFMMLNRQSDNILEGGKLFLDSVNGYTQLTHEEREEHQKKMKDTEEKGDKLSKQIIEQIDKDFITPFDREDIHELTVLLDDIIDSVDTTFRRMVVYNLNKTDNIILELNKIVFESIEEVNLAIRDLKRLKDIKAHCVKIDMLENQADRILSNGFKTIFQNIKDPILLFKTKEIYEYMESITDRCKDVSIILQSIVVKHG